MSRGPSMLAPVRCLTLELKDLADTQDFDLNGEIGAFYGFEYTADGYYKRKEIEDKKIPKLEQLRNIEASIIDNFEYKLVRKDNKWILTPLIGWKIKFEFISPYTYFDNQRNFRKAFNAGPIHISLIPENNSRREIEIKIYKKIQYMLHRKDSVTKEAVTRLQFMPQMPLTSEFTLIFDISIHRDDNPDDGVGISDKLAEGISISWVNLDVEALRIIVVIQKSGDEIKAISSTDKVILNVTPENLKELTYINITNLDLIGFYYTENVLSEDILSSLTTIP